MPKELKTSVIVDTSKAERSISNLINKINSINGAMSRVGRGSDQLTQKLNQSTRQTQQLQNATNGVSEAMSRANNATREHNRLLSVVVSKAKMLSATYLGIMGMKALVKTSDMITGAENKLNYINSSNLGDQGLDASGGYSKATLQQTQQQLDKMFTSSQKVRMGYSDMISNVSKSMVLAGKAFNNNMDNAIRFQEVMSEAYTIGGASEREKSQSMYQLVQALGSKKLQGEELRSVSEGAQLAYQAIEKFAQGVYNSDEALKDMAADGKITSDIVVAAILNAGDQMDAAFARSAMTFDQAWTMMKNSATKAFEGMAQEMNKVLNSKAVVNFILGFSKVLSVVGAIGTKIISVFGMIINAIADNWYWLKYVVYGVIAAIVAWLAVLAGRAIVTAVSMAASFLASLFPLYGIIIALGLVVGMMVWVAGGAQQLKDGIVEGIGIIVGVITVAISFVLNLIQLIVNAIAVTITIIVSAVVNAGIAVCNAIATVANVAASTGEIIKNVFSAAFSYAQQKGWEFANSIASAILRVANMINSILGVFGISVDTSGFEGLVSATAGKMQAAQTNVSTSLGNAKELLSSAFGSSEGKLNYINTKNATTKASTFLGTAFESGWKDSAYNAGANAVSNAGSAIGSGMSWITDKLSSITGGLSNKIGDLMTSNNGLSTDDVSSILGTNNPLSGSGGGGGGSGSGGAGGKSTSDKILDDTGDILDTLRLTESDLKSLYDLAELEWKKDFTTNRITINMTNNNSINGGDRDLEGLATKLTDSLYEELNTSAGGVLNI